MMNVLVIPSWYPSGKDKLMGIYHKEFCEALANKNINVNMLFIERERLNNPIKYLSRVLADYRDKGIKTIDEAKNNLPIKEEQASGGSFNERKYSKDEINALFQSIEEIDV